MSWTLLESFESTSQGVACLASPTPSWLALPVSTSQGEDVDWAEGLDTREYSNTLCNKTTREFLLVLLKLHWLHDSDPVARIVANKLASKCASYKRGYLVVSV